MLEILENCEILKSLLFNKIKTTDKITLAETHRLSLKIRTKQIILTNFPPVQ